MLRNEEGDLDWMMLDKLQHAKYSLNVWFLEMHRVATAIDELAADSHELKRFFPSVFVGMTREDFARGAYNADLRTKNVAVLFLDIVKFSALCVSHEVYIQDILQTVLASLESPVFRKKGFSKRLGDGFMAAFGYSSADNDIRELCKRAHSCARSIVRNLPKVNTDLGKRIPEFSPGLRIRIGISCGRATIGIVRTDSMSNADVFGSVVNLAQRMEDSGRYQGLDDLGVPVLFAPEETPRATITVTPEVYAALDETDELTQYPAMRKKFVIIKNETKPRLVYVHNQHDV
eukprot:TRINITY_DN11119_c0_g1_i2.p1 TRINITY_DN11119_c0_g1~~TRINITY_DN11119_c0_g1_i2.p1  ORF type:complete len:289 (+),score=64.34 TRINITY_DN11119_c0_g1_i2:307-1173(+)